MVGIRITTLAARSSILALAAAVASSAWGAPHSGTVSIDSDDIGGVVRGPKGPEAGVWVIAQTHDLPSELTKIVTTDDEGRYVLPDLPEGKYKVWVRGYGLVDSAPVESKRGVILNLNAVPAPDARAAAQYYPASYWFAMMHPPAASEFPGTGVSGNGFLPSTLTQDDWLGDTKELCLACHQLGTLRVRTLPKTEISPQIWDARLQIKRAENDPVLGVRSAEVSAFMNGAFTSLGRPGSLKVFADWTDRIAAGELPAEAPPRPTGVERNAVITLYTFEGGRFTHDEVTTDRRNPRVNANGLLYASTQLSGTLETVDPVSYRPTSIPIPGPDGSAHDLTNQAHNPMMDQNGRVWMSDVTARGQGHSFCTDGSTAYSKYFPGVTSNYAELYTGSAPGSQGRQISVYDPATKQMSLLPVCFGSHHLAMGTAPGDDSIYYSGDYKMIGWVDTKIWAQTKDAVKSQGWCPLVVDTNGDGTITPDRTQWNPPGEVKDPTRDTPIYPNFLYGINSNPVDGSMWMTQPRGRDHTGTKGRVDNLRSTIVRFERGKNPPLTCKTEVYRVPEVAGRPVAMTGRGIDFDSKGIAWIGYNSGSLGRFDRSKCKVTKGPTTIDGTQCPEGWTFYSAPGPRFAGTQWSTDNIYQNWVDHFNTLGLGKDVPILPYVNSDAIGAFLPESKKFVTIRVPYPRGMLTRLVDGRIDDPNTGWKGKALYTNYAEVPTWHKETGDTPEGSKTKAVRIQMRPDPLAH